MFARKPRQATTITDEEGGKKKKAPPSGKSKKTTPAKQPKHVKKKTSKPSPSKKIHKRKVMKVHKGKRSDHLVDEEDEEPQPASEPQVEDDEYNLQRGIQMSLESFQAPVDGVAIREPASENTQRLPVVEGKGKGIATYEQAAKSLLDLQKPKKQNTAYQYIFQRRTPVTQNASTRSSAQPQDNTSTNVFRDTPSPVDAETGVDTEKSNSEADTEILNVDEEQGEDISYTVALEERIAEFDEGQAGSDPVYPQVHESLKLTTEEHVHMENPPSSSGTLSSMKNLDDAFTFAPPLSTSVIDLSPPKPSLPPVQEPIFTTTLLLPPPPPQQQSTIVLELATRVSALEKIYMYSKIDNYVKETVKEAVQNALQALVRECFRELLEFKMKEIRRDWMFESGSYRSHPEHAALYDALEVSMDRKNEEKFIEATAKSCKIRRDDQDPPPPPPKDLDQYKKKRHDSDASASKQPPIGKSKLVKADLEGPTYKLVRPFHKNNISLQFQMEECHLLLTDQIDLVNLKGDKERSNALSISKLKAAYYPDFELEEFVLPLWIRSECDYYISEAYGISHWWFKHKEFYITRHSAPFDRHAVRSHMRILSVFSLKTFSRYGYTYLKETVLRRADYKEYKISEADFKNLHSNDFKDMCLLHLQGKLNHLSGADKVHLFNAINLWIRNIVIRQRVKDLQLKIQSYQMKLNLAQSSWDASDFQFKEDYTIVRKPRVII
uniref:Uncharacterized protein n=1 Tax=Tanacetum cinerariifolium TaxID=118510 RepID=A0A6L2KKU3_TANCI|nr:hypothetical protein [Tanacetum cinerariifolium]